MAKAPATQSVPIARAKGRRRTPPGLLGFSALLTPDTKFDEDGVFTTRIHLNEDQQEALAAEVEAHVIGALFDELEATAGKKLKRPTGKQWVADKLTPPNENARIQLPSIQLKCAASFKSKKNPGEIVKKVLPHYDRKDNLLDGGQLRTGMGSLVQIIYTPGLYTGPLTKGYAEPTLRLEGIVVLKNEPWGTGSGAGSGSGEYSDAEIAKLVGDDVEMDDDLSAFAQSKEAPAKGAVPAGKASAPPAQDDAEEYDLDDSIPF